MLGRNTEKEYSYAITMAIITGSLIAVSLVVIFSSEEFIVFQQVWTLLAKLWWIILPFPIYSIFRIVFGEYTEVMWIKEQKSILLEIKPPADVEESPKLMEFVVTGFHDYSSRSKFETYCGWSPLQAKYTFEVVSLEGVVHFYVRCPIKLREHAEIQIYAHYPDAEIFEVEDYMNKLPKNLPNAEWDVWGTTFVMTKSDAYPIRTYKEFQEEVTGRMVDPMASLTEAFSQLGTDEYAGVQLVFGSEAGKNYKKRFEAELNKVMHKETPEDIKGLAKLWSLIVTAGHSVVAQIFGLPLPEPPKKDEFSMLKLNPQEQEEAKAILRKMSHSCYNAVLRYIYVGKRSVFRKGVGVTAPLGALKQVNDANFNMLLADNVTKTYAQYYFIKPRLLYRQRKIVQDFRDRSYQGLQKILSAPEIATIFHIPDKSVKAPTIQHIEAKKGEAPFNLPILDE